ncbi:hypothetical protein D3C72_1375230 [compost metagenome]
MPWSMKASPGLPAGRRALERRPRRLPGRLAAGADRAAQASIMVVTLAARSIIANGFVMTSMPGSSSPLPTAAFSA